LGRASIGPAQVSGWVQPGPKNKKKERKICWAEIDPNIWAYIGPYFLGAVLGPVSWAGPAHVYSIYIIILKQKKFKFFQKSFQKNCDFLKYFSTNFA
jgi:hypothetical protein